MVLEFTDLRQASSAAVQFIIDLAVSAVRDQGFCTIALSGGSTPRLMYETLGSPGWVEQMPWNRCHFFWGDERWVAATHPDSNFAMAAGTLFAGVDIPRQNIHRIVTEYEDPETGAAAYEDQLHTFFSGHPPAVDQQGEPAESAPEFDLVLLGMGLDGHIASLFPGSSILAEKKKWVAAVPAGIGKPPVPRITLTLPVFNRARHTLFLVSGGRKRRILDSILTNPAEAEALYPAARIKPAGALVWMAAAKT